MNLKDMREDLEYLVEKVKSVHISTVAGLNKNQINIVEQAYKSLSDKTTLSEFIFIANSVIVSLNDVHSRLEVNFEEGDKYLDIKCLWLDSGVYVVEDSEFVKKGDDIVNNNIENIIIDLRNNMGGDSRVCNEFFKYLDMNKYKEYRIDERVSRDTIEVYRNIFNENYNANEGYIKCEEKNIVIENVMYEDFKGKFKGNIYVIVSNTTFSSARIFAVLVKDNNLGKIVGEPTGGKPSSYGNVLRYKMPNSKVKFSLSTKNFRRPDSSRDEEDSLYPDIEACTIIEDIIDGKDTQIEMIKSLIRRGIK